MSVELISRNEAKNIGQSWYYTGQPCKHGHIEKRQTVNGICRKCARISAADRHSRNPEVRAIYKRKNAGRIKRQSADYYQRVKDTKLKKYREDNKEKIAADTKAWAERNKSVVAEYKLKYYKERYRNDPLFKCVERCRGMLWRCMARPKAGKRTHEILGYTAREFKKDLESKFLPGMSWDNYGDWHVDHIIPVSAMVKAGIEDPGKINALSNLQPLWAKDNMAKRDQVPEGVCL